MNNRQDDSPKDQTQHKSENTKSRGYNDAGEDSPLDLKSPVLMDLRYRIVSPPISVMIADEDKLFIEGISAIIEQWDEFQLVAKATKNDDVMNGVIQYTPAILLLGVRMQDAKSSEIIRDISAQGLETRVALIASSNEGADVLEALRAGALGYAVREEINADRLRGVLWGVAAGEVILSGIGTRLKEELLKPAETATFDDDSFNALTKREREVLALLVEGLSNAEISQRLYLSEPTIKKIISQVIDKLQVANRVQAAVLATRHTMNRQE